MTWHMLALDHNESTLFVYGLTEYGNVKKNPVVSVYIINSLVMAMTC